MSKKKICFIAQFPPPIHGLSKAVETLYNSELSQKLDFEKVDITNNRNFFKNFVAISKSKADLFYFTISQTKGGNLRDLIIMKLLQIQHKKCLVHLHGGYYRQLVDNDLSLWQRKANYKAVKKLDGVIVLGNSLKSIFQGMLPDEKIFVVPNCVDDEYLMGDDEFDEKMSLIDRRVIKDVLYLSNFIRSKGYLEVLEMAKLEKERCIEGEERKFHFNFAGKFFEKAEEEYFFRYIEKYELNDYVTYHGIVSGNKKRELLRICDVFVLLTRYPNEGQPISILEAMGNGMIMVVTDHAGIPDIVRNGVNGIVINKKKIDIHKCYYTILNEYLEDMQIIIRENRELVKNIYNQKNYVDNICKIFRNI